MPYTAEERRQARACGNDISALITAKRTAAFWVKVDIRGDDECWPWLGSRTTAGYGTCNYGPLGTTAHRVSFLLAGNVLLPGQQVLHHCDHPWCMNNKGHLFAGTQGENLADMRTKGRAPDCRNFGEHNGRTRFTDEEIELVRMRYKNGATQTRLAQIFEVSVTTINRIVNDKSHRHKTPKTRAENPRAPDGSRL